MSVHGVRGARDAVDIEADAHFDPDRRDVGEGGLRQIFAAELLPGELRPRQAAFGHVRLELKRLPAALDLEVETFGEGLLQPALADAAPGADHVRVHVY